MVGRGVSMNGHWILLVALLFFSVACGAAFNLTTVQFDEGYSHLFGDGNLVRSPDGQSVSLLLSRYSGSGFISSDLYHHGFFSATIKLPAGYTAGIVVAFYMSNGDIFEKTHDELDFEFLGNIRGRKWRLQTNVYGNGSTSRGREERYYLPFDPASEPHRYSILWTPETVIFYVDETPIREVARSDAMGGDYPSKPMAVYATIWDASNWATSGGKYKVDYNYSPFVAEFSDFVLVGRRTDPIQQVPADVSAGSTTELPAAVASYASMTAEKRRAMGNFREHFMTYSNCYDTLRYPVTLPDCNVIPSEKSRFKQSGHSVFVSHRRSVRHRTRRSRVLPATSRKRQASM